MDVETTASACPLCCKVFRYGFNEPHRSNKHASCGAQPGMGRQPTAIRCRDINLLRRHARYCTDAPRLMANAVPHRHSSSGPVLQHAQPLRQEGQLVPSYVLPHLPHANTCHNAAVRSLATRPSPLTLTAVKSSGASAVLGNVCWFCRTAVGPADNKTTSLYG